MVLIQNAEYSNIDIDIYVFILILFLYRDFYVNV